ncbi:MAG: hypothetical protein NZ772_16715 [Cyanobacteria bacterium]|nr:hypothetical protein [Cyanobacteriota bacterium]MDW8202342.1 hypothetical protein [Cyanobacteriota bacterium SKYGB_h_bin112]
MLSSVFIKQQVYYLYDPDRNRLQGWLRQDSRLIPIANMAGWVSPRLGIRLETSSGTLEIYRPDGQRFENYVEVSQRAEQEARRAEQEARRAEQEAQARRDAIARLLALGLSREQVATALGFSVHDLPDL